MRRLALLLAVALASGCLATPNEEQPSAPEATELRVGDALLHHDAKAGGLSLLHLAQGGPTMVAFGEGVLVVSAEGRLLPAGDAVTLADGQIVQFVPPYGASAIDVTVDGEARSLPLATGEAFVAGERVIELMKIQRDRFAHRTPGHENYTNAVAYFEEFFSASGYEVETFTLPSAIPDVKVPVGPGPSTQSATSVVAVKRGTTQADRYLVFGGHFDVVEQVTHGAFDNTGGTMAVLAMAEAFARVNTSHSIVFAAWGGEEDGIVGSQAWLSGHPELVPMIDLYVNFDVTGLAWPAPIVDPAPVVIATGPDGPMGDALAAQHAQVAATWLALPDAPFVYESIVGGQATGAGVNAQSDHTPFATRKIPVVFQFTQDIAGAFTLIHKETDTVENMTAYALLGPQGVGEPLEPAQTVEGEAALARSFETQMMGAFYMVALLDAGVFDPAAPASLPALVNARP